MSNDVNWTICFFDILWIYPPTPQDASLASLRHHQDYNHFLREGKFPRNNLHLPLSRSKNEGLVGIPFLVTETAIHLFRVGATDPKYESFHLKHTTSTHPPWICQKNYGLAHLFGQLAWKKNHPRTTPATPGGKKNHPSNSCFTGFSLEILTMDYT